MGLTGRSMVSLLSKGFWIVSVSDSFRHVMTWWQLRQTRHGLFSSKAKGCFWFEHLAQTTWKIFVYILLVISCLFTKDKRICGAYEKCIGYITQCTGRNTIKIFENWVKSGFGIYKCIEIEITLAIFAKYDYKY